MRKFKVECDFGGGGFNDDDFISELFYEANQNNIMVVIGDFSV